MDCDGPTTKRLKGVDEGGEGEDEEEVEGKEEGEGKEVVGGGEGGA